jgi:purine-nucleoside phosphorylase
MDMRSAECLDGAETALVLGSGLGVLAEGVDVVRRIPFAAVDGMPQSRVAGHAGEFVVGMLERTMVVLMCGRVHLYEGNDPQGVTAGIRWLAAGGVKRVVLTNAAGAVNAGFRPGTWMMITDQLNLTGSSPLEGEAAFVDMSGIYSESWCEEWRALAGRRGMILHEGVYAGVRGPQYETPAEVRMLRTLGADAVGMSTVLEAIAARAAGMEVAGFSCLTNSAAGVGERSLSHTEVLATGRLAAKEMAELLRAMF